MKRLVAVISTFFAVALLTGAAQAGSNGEQTFKQRCAMCHAVKGQGGAVGPDLTQISSKMKEKDLRGKLDHPNSSMPSFRSLPKPDMDALIAYLKSLK